MDKTKWTKMNKIAEFSIMDEKEIRNFRRNLDKKWPTGRPKNVTVL